MINLPLPDINNDSLLDSIIQNKKLKTRNALLPFMDAIKSRYNYYIMHNNDLENIMPLDATWDDIHEELLSCYGANVAFSAAKKSLISAMPLIIQSKCPYCMLSRPNTLDHYFDKSKYPEFSVFIPNLVVCCSECNTMKGIKTFNDGERQYIHFYYDQLPKYKFLFFRFDDMSNDHIPNIRIYLQFPEEERAAQIINTHFSNLSLFVKYKESTSEKLSLIIREIHTAIGRGLSYDSIRGLIDSRYQAMIEHYGYNYWESCIYEGIINSPDFMDHLIS